MFHSHIIQLEHHVVTVKDERISVLDANLYSTDVLNTD